METRTKLFSCIGYALRTSRLLDVPESTQYLSLALHALQSQEVQNPKCLPSRKTDGRTIVSLFDALAPLAPAPVIPEVHGCILSVPSEIGQVIQQQCRSMVGDAMDRIGQSAANLCEVMSKQDLRIQELQETLSALSEQTHEQIIQQASSGSSFICQADSVAPHSETPTPTTERNAAARPRRKADATCQDATLAKQRRREERRQMLLGKLNM
eukprot:Skav235318  [mRNA]  locus=scaffold520:463786:464421:+ [translate_table: standard]